MNGTFTSYAAVLMVSAGQVAQQQRTVRRARPVTSADPRLITLGTSGIIVSALMLARILRITRSGRPALPVSGLPRRALMNISGSVALVSGANRGLGRAFARELVRRGAAKVYGAARDPAKVTEPGVLPVALDITDGEQVARVAAQCTDVSLLVNNAGVLRYSTFTSAPDLDGARQEMEVNYFGTLRMCRAFAPGLAAAGGGAIVNMLSITSFFTNPFNASYGASKAAEWSLTNGVRLELHHQGTLVVAVHAGFVDTEMAALTDAPKISPESVARQAFDAVEAGQVEVLADERSRDVKAKLSRDHELIYPPIQEFWDAAVTGTGA
jgi:NAD(P)-dependent dehydrogenase (short-subunit alcohol dehydrogenase family)